MAVRICFVGDSFVNGTGDDDCLGWTGRICAAARRAGHDVTHYNLGIRRDTSADIAARWRAEAGRRLPPGMDGRLVFSFGANDCAAAEEGPGATRLPLSRSLELTEAILAEARAWRPVLMIGPPPLGEPEGDRHVGALSAALAGLCARLEVPCLEVFPALSAVAAWRKEAASGDGAHPNAGGYGALAALVAAWPAWQAWLPPGG